MRWKAYPKYRPSGVEWLGTIPENWPVKRLRFCLKVNPSKAETRGLRDDTPVSFVPMEAVGECGGLRLDQTKAIAEVAVGYTYFGDGDVIVAKITPCFENGKGAIAAGLENGVGFGTTELHVLRPGSDVDRKYVFYLTLGHAFRNIGTSYMYGAGGQKRVPEDFVRDFRHPVPTISEQQAIAAFLDCETARIDALIEKKQRQIELLQEKRAALISLAVTKGLNPNAKMKDSGIEWLGQIPEHWHLRRMKHVCKRIFVGVAEAATHAYVDEGIPMLRSTDVRASRIRTDDIRYIDRGFAERLPSKQLRTGDVVTVRTGNAGVSALVPTEYDGGQCFTLVVSRPTRGQDGRYFCYWLNADPGQQQFEVEGMGTAQINISVPIVQNMIVCVPPSVEQKQIADMVDNKLARLDVLITKIRDTIACLKEYRTALISAAVTGKIDVRQEVA